MCLRSLGFTRKHVGTSRVHVVEKNRCAIKGEETLHNKLPMGINNVPGIELSQRRGKPLNPEFAVPQPCLYLTNGRTHVNLGGAFV